MDKIHVMKTLKNIWQWLSGSHEGIEEPVYAYGETVIPREYTEYITRLINYDKKPIRIGDIMKLPKTIKPRIGRRKISNIVRYR